MSNFVLLILLTHYHLRWDDLEKFTSEEDSAGGPSCWELGLGRILAAFSRKDWSALETNLQVRISFCSPISIFDADCENGYPGHTFCWQG